MLFTIYIMALNVILAGFSDEAVTVLGLYYKIQSFFFIPLSGLQTCIVPLLSYTYARGRTSGASGPSRTPSCWPWALCWWASPASS